MTDKKLIRKKDLTDKLKALYDVMEGIKLFASEEKDSKYTAMINAIHVLYSQNSIIIKQSQELMNYLKPQNKYKKIYTRSKSEYKRRYK